MIDRLRPIIIELGASGARSSRLAPPPAAMTRRASRGAAEQIPKTKLPQHVAVDDEPGAQLDHVRHVRTGRHVKVGGRLTAGPWNLNSFEHATMRNGLSASNT